MIALFTDFTLRGPYVGQMHAVLAQLAPDVAVIDLMHDAPCCNPHAAACLLAHIIDTLPTDACVLAVVDPGVGDPARDAVVLQADGRHFVGPDNGLLSHVAGRATDVYWWRITWRPRVLSASFHGRDLFAPVAARLALGEECASLAVPVSSPRFPPVVQAGLGEVIYVDAFGNLITGWPAERVSGTARVRIAGRELEYARTFSETGSGDLFWYCNSMGLVEIAQNKGSAAGRLGVGIGAAIEIVGG